MNHSDDLMNRLVRLFAFFGIGFVVRPLSISRLVMLLVLLGIIAYTGDL